MCEPRDFGIRATPDEATKPERVKVTDQMVEAGLEQWRLWEDSDDYSGRNLVEAIYRAMKALDSSPPDAPQ
jgi:hypothetical protein